MTDYFDRRRNDEPIAHERRLEERISILEIRTDNHQTTINDTQDLMQRLFDKFDSHISEEMVQSQSISNTMIKVSNTVDNLTNEIKRTNDTLVTFATKVDTTHDKVNEWDTIVKTIAKIVTILAIITGAGWSILSFVVDHKDTITQTIQ